MVTPAPDARPARLTPRVKAARLWWLAHQWAGLKVAVFMAFIMATGTLATCSHEIDWALDPSLRVTPATVEAEVNWAGSAASLAAASPDAVITRIDAPVHPWFAAQVFYTAPDGQRRRALTHPTTGAVQADRSILTAQVVLRRLHRHLFLPVAYGVPIVSALAVILAVTMVTSFWVYKKWWRGFLRAPRTRDARTLTGDLHRLAGVWSLWFIALMIVTGLWYLVESLGGRAPPPPRADVAPIERTSAELAAALPASVAAVRETWPSLRVERVVFPTARSGAFVFQGQDRAILVRARANAVWTDAQTGDAAMTASGDAMGVHQRIGEAADPLHFGTFGGVWTKVIWAVFGAALTGLSVTGAMIYALRLTRGTRGEAASATGAAWRGMGLARWPSSGLVLVGMILAGVVGAQVL